MIPFAPSGRSGGSAGRDGQLTCEADEDQGVGDVEDGVGVGDFPPQTTADTPHRPCQHSDENGRASSTPAVLKTVCTMAAR